MFLKKEEIDRAASLAHSDARINDVIINAHINNCNQVLNLSSNNFVEKINKSAIKSFFNITEKEVYKRTVEDISRHFSNGNLSKQSTYSSVMMSLIPLFLRDESINELELIKSFHERISGISKLKRNRSYESIKKECKTEFGNTESDKIVDIILDNCDKNTHIEVNRKDLLGKNSVVCKLYTGQSYFFDFPEAFYADPDVGCIKEINNCDILIVEGLIEFVHEIHHVLEEYSYSKKNLIIVAINYGEEVLSTLLANKKKKNLNIFPLIVPRVDEYKSFLLSLSKYSGCRIISEDFGDRISSIKKENFGNVSCCKLIRSRKKIIIKEKGAKSKNNTHILEVNINKNVAESFRIEHEIGCTINKLNNSIKSGVIKISDIEDFIENTTSRKFKAVDEIIMELLRHEKDFRLSSDIDMMTLYDYVKNILSTCIIFSNSGGIIAKKEDKI